MIGAGISVFGYSPGGSGPVISAEEEPVILAVTFEDTPADALPASATNTANYVSSEGAIVSAVATYTVNGVAVSSAYDLDGGDILSITVVVSDDQGNSSPFFAGETVVTGDTSDPWIMATGAWNDAGVWDDTAAWSDS